MVWVVQSTTTKKRRETKRGGMRDSSEQPVPTASVKRLKAKTSTDKTLHGLHVRGEPKTKLLPPTWPEHPPPHLIPLPRRSVLQSKCRRSARKWAKGCTSASSQCWVHWQPGVKSQMHSDFLSTIRWDLVVERERAREREGACMWGIIPSHKPPFDTTRWVLVSLNNPCCSIKFADELLQDHVSELKGPEREEQGGAIREEWNGKRRRGIGRRREKLHIRLLKRLLFSFFFFMSKKGEDGIYRDSDGPRSLADQWIIVTADTSQDGIFHIRKNYGSKLDWMVTAKLFWHVTSSWNTGEPSSWRGFCSSTWTNTEEKSVLSLQSCTKFHALSLHWIFDGASSTRLMTKNKLCLREGSCCCFCMLWADGLPEQSYWLVAAATFGSGGLINKLLTLKKC